MSESMSPRKDSTNSSSTTPTSSRALTTRQPRPKPKTEFLLPPVSKQSYGKLGFAFLAVWGLVLAGVLLARSGLVSDAWREATCTEFGPQKSSVSHKGLSVDVQANALLGRFGVLLGDAPIPPEATQKLSEGFTARSTLFSIKTCRTLPQHMTLSVLVPPQVNDLNMLDLYAWDGSAWHWLGAQTDAIQRTLTAQVKEPPTQFALIQTQPTRPMIGTEIPSRDANTGGAMTLPSDTIKEVFPNGLYLGDMGDLAGDRSKISPPQAGVRSFPTIRNWNESGVVNRMLVRGLLSSPPARAAHARNILAFVQQNNYDGIALDYRGIDLAQREKLTEFVALLGKQMRDNGKKLVVVVPAPARVTHSDPTQLWDSGAYDLPAISKHADMVGLDLCTDPAAFATDDLDNLLQWAVSQINRQKLQLIVPSLSTRQTSETSNRMELLKLDEALSSFSFVGDAAAPFAPNSTAQFLLKVDGTADVIFDANTQTYHYTSLGLNGAQTLVWLNTAASFRNRLQRISQYHIRGVTVRGLMMPGNDSGVTQVLGEYQNLAWIKASSPLQVSVQLGSRPAAWAQVNGTSIAVQLPAETGEYVLLTSVNGSKPIAVLPGKVLVR